MSNLVFLDFETTGLGAERLKKGPQKGRRDEVLEVGIIDSDGNVLMDQLVRPVERKTWDTAQHKKPGHGISPQDVASAPTFDDMAPAIAELISGKRIAVFNHPFDARFLPDWLKREPTSFICLKQLYYRARDVRKGSMETAMKWVGHEKPPHRAVGDAQCALILWNFIEAHSGDQFDALVQKSTYEPPRPADSAAQDDEEENPLESIWDDLDDLHDKINGFSALFVAALANQLKDDPAMATRIRHNLKRLAVADPSVEPAVPRIIPLLASALHLLEETEGC